MTMGDTAPPPPRPAASLAHRLATNVAKRLKHTVAAVGVVTALGLVLEYQKLRPPPPEDEKNKKQVLVIPFHRLQLLEQESSSRWKSPTFDNLGGSDRMTVLTVRQLVQLLHQAAQDENICALYGVFGHGGSCLSQAGWADLEEVRNALRVVRESHRRHAEPNVAHANQVIPRVPPKPLYAYADSFASLTDPGNREYYLASIFTHLHLQRQGELNLFGLLSEHVFVRGFLEQYGIAVHVFKHGNYKNAPNMFTDYVLNKYHRENATSILKALDADVCSDISASRSKALLASWLRKPGTKNGSLQEVWQQVHNAGTLTALEAWKTGFVDYLPHRDPLPDLVAANDPKAPMTLVPQNIHQGWNLDETDFKDFKANKIVMIGEYARKVQREEQRLERLERWQRHAAKHPILGKLLSLVGLDEASGESTIKKERIALVHLEGTIGDAAARQAVDSIRKIRKQQHKDNDVKAVVLRVTSRGGMMTPCETIAQELKALDLPVVVSFGNVSASGGYYVSAAAQRIFGSYKTLTGSIGVFGIRPDVTQLALNYGIRAQQVTAGDLSALNNPLAPMTRPMKQTMAASIDRYYAQFKDVVAKGRDLPEDYVESIAQGRVYTGDQAKTNGLVDELGGLDRAIAYAQRNYTTSGDAKVEVWPKKKTLFELLAEAKEQNDVSMVFAVLSEYFLGSQSARTEESSSDTTKMVEGIVDWLLHSSANNSAVPPLAGVVLAADEDTAIRCLLEQAGSQVECKRSPVFPSTGFWE